MHMGNGVQGITFHTYPNAHRQEQGIRKFLCCTCAHLSAENVYCDVIASVSNVANAAAVVSTIHMMQSTWLNSKGLDNPAALAFENFRVEVTNECGQPCVYRVLGAAQPPNEIQTDRNVRIFLNPESSSPLRKSHIMTVVSKPRQSWQCDETILFAPMP
eukprot:SAG31_NODE_194_length_20722_cov_19.854192_5_plen_159_part_00